MAQTHDDRDFGMPDDLMQRLSEKAAEMTAAGVNTITAGEPDEKALEEVVGVFLVRKLPDDPDCLRISVGAPHTSREGSYVVIRGDADKAVATLRSALHALELSRMVALAEWRRP